MERALTRVVSIVVVTWNSAPYLPRCLAGIAGQTHQPLERIAIDNGSSDDSAALCERAGFRVVRNETNRGYSAAMNQGFALATGEFVLALNPDCFLEPRYVETVIAAMGEDVGTASGVLRRAAGYEIRPMGGIDSAGMRMTRNGRHLDMTQAPSAVAEVFGVSGAAAVYRRTLLDDVKIDGEILDEDFFAYREDADLAWRARLFGWRSIVVPDAIGHHVRRVTPEVRAQLPANLNMHSVKNRFLLRSKNQGWYLAIRNAPFELARDLLVVLAALTIERSSLPAFGWLWRNRARIRAKRRAIQARRKVSDRDLARWFR
ncbi:MAG TPA: glycosyltransferase family 2 protein [Thermoanaerobaculia bacterium]|jgi:GT2 family glycosyltransferase